MRRIITALAVVALLAITVFGTPSILGDEPVDPYAALIWPNVDHAAADKELETEAVISPEEQLVEASVAGVPVDEF